MRSRREGINRFVKSRFFTIRAACAGVGLIGIVLGLTGFRSLAYGICVPLLLLVSYVAVRNHSRRRRVEIAELLDRVDGMTVHDRLDSFEEIAKKYGRWHPDVKDLKREMFSSDSADVNG